MRSFLLIAILLAFASCARKVTNTQSTYKSTYHSNVDSTVQKETLRLDTITSDADTAGFDIPFDTPTTHNDTGLTAAPSPAPFRATINGKKANLEVSIEGGRLKGRCICNAEKMLIAAKDTEIKRLKATTHTEIKFVEKRVNVPKPYVPWWVWVVFPVGGLVLAALVLFLKRVLNPLKFL